MHSTMCKGRPGLCDAMKPTKGADLLKYLRKVNFTGINQYKKKNLVGYIFSYYLIQILNGNVRKCIQK